MSHPVAGMGTKPATYILFIATEGSPREPLSTFCQLNRICKFAILSQLAGKGAEKAVHCPCAPHRGDLIELFKTFQPEPSL